MSSAVEFDFESGVDAEREGDVGVVDGRGEWSFCEGVVERGVSLGWNGGGEEVLVKCITLSNQILIGVIDHNHHTNNNNNNNNDNNNDDNNNDDDDDDDCVIATGYST